MQLIDFTPFIQVNIVMQGIEGYGYGWLHSPSLVGYKLEGLCVIHGKVSMHYVCHNYCSSCKENFAKDAVMSMSCHNEEKRSIIIESS